MAELVDGLPDDHPMRGEVEQRFVSLVDACLAVQDADGVFHQELTMHDSYVETSGTGLILYAVGIGLQRGLLGERHRAALAAGLQGYLSYVALDGSVHHTCVGCLCPDGGLLPSYLARAHKLNDTHAFGPVVLAFGQAAAIGLGDVAIR
ncbi:MAG: glycoside hydrolase family 88 protein [Gammaproteobacteria bacterium]|nr:glycoside hydrolase family 88 protein [Gammaproteobacteria bacterium]